jgi:hypothetical protein
MASLVVALLLMVGMYSSPCPDTAVCVGGGIDHCHTQDVLMEGKGCETVATIIQLLETWTIVDFCNPDGNPDALGHSTENRPFFGYSQLTGELDVGMDGTAVLKNMPDVFVLDTQSDGRLRVALHESHRVVLPSTCAAKNTLRSLLLGISSAVLAVFRWTVSLTLSSLSVYWSLFYELPLETLVFTVVVIISGWLVIGFL